jgi:hypothetical protein
MSGRATRALDHGERIIRRCIASPGHMIIGAYEHPASRDHSRMSNPIPRLFHRGTRVGAIVRPQL